jgi:hypothetical protein
MPLCKAHAQPPKPPARPTAQRRCPGAERVRPKQRGARRAACRRTSEHTRASASLNRPTADSSARFTTPPCSPCAHEARLRLPCQRIPRRLHAREGEGLQLRCKLAAAAGSPRQSARTDAQGSGASGAAQPRARAAPPRACPREICARLRLGPPASPSSLLICVTQHAGGTHAPAAPAAQGRSAATAPAPSGKLARRAAEARATETERTRQRYTHAERSALSSRTSFWPASGASFASLKSCTAASCAHVLIPSAGAMPAAAGVARLPPASSARLRLPRAGSSPVWVARRG